jgi:subtilisin family serine protease
MHRVWLGGLITLGVAAIAAGASPTYPGVSPTSPIVDLRTSDAAGQSVTSDVIAAIDFATANKAALGIDVINMSLGHPIYEPAATDPMVQAVEAAVRAGLVVVASAGNRGKTDDGRPILGGITSPGNSPYAITVGALNTWNTVSRSDDSVTTYSSRGPTRFDFAVKPDLVAPGVAILAARSAPSAEAAGTPLLTRKTGTSMAAPNVAGAVALMLEVSPHELHIEEIHNLLLTNTRKLADPQASAPRAGSGLLDVAAAVEAARRYRRFPEPVMAGSTAVREMAYR